MPFLTTTFRRSISAAALFATLVVAESCYYPDGTVSSDIPCSPGQAASSCCSSQSWCLSGGLCLDGGIVTRGSCTDKNWNSDECAAVCTTVNTDSDVAVTPCSAGLSSNSFVCGLGGDVCKDSSNTFSMSTDTKIILRPAQVQAVAGNAIVSGVAGSTATVTAAATAGDGLYPAGALIGCGAGVGLPLLIALGVVIYLLVLEKKKQPQSRKTMYTIPEDDDLRGSIMIRPAPSMLQRGDTRSSNFSKMTDAYSDRGSFRTTKTGRTAGSRPLFIQTGTDMQKPPSLHSPVQSIAESQRASHIPSFAERIETTKVVPQIVEVRDSSTTSGSRHELDSTPTGTPTLHTPNKVVSPPISPNDIPRFELAAQRMSR